MSDQGSLVSYMTSLSGLQLESLFGQQYAVLAILRSLQPMARHILLRFVTGGGDVSAALVSSWATAEGDSKLAGALQELQGLHLLARVAHGGQAVYAINPNYQAQLRSAICNGLLSGRHSALPPSAAAAAAVPSAAQLSAYARQQWEALLLYLVNSNSEPPAAPLGLGAAAINIPQLLTAAGFIGWDEAGMKKMSERGFQFLLADLYSQLWSVLRQYLDDLPAASSASASASPELPVAINFLFRLGLQAGEPMCYSQLGGAEQAIAAHMAQLGLLMPVSAAGELWLHPTRLAAVLAGGGRAGEAGAAAAEDGFVIVESNFRVYAYTTSAVQAAILRVFVRSDALLPNLFVGTISRDSATAALAAGITAEQMVGFLRQHAHPRVAAKSPVVPPVVADQIRLWQQELGRLAAHPSKMYENFESPQLYASAAAFAQEGGALLYKNDDRQQLVVPAAFHDRMKLHLQQQKAALGL